MYKAEEITFTAGDKVGKVSGLLILPKGAEALLVLAHGAGAGMRHKFMEEAAKKLADHSVGTLRYQFPYMEKEIKRPDSRSRSHRYCAGGRCVRDRPRRGFAAFCGRQVHGRANDIARCGEGTIGGCVRLDLFWLPAACRRKTVGGPWPSSFRHQTANAIPAGIARCSSRSQTSQTALC